MSPLDGMPASTTLNDEVANHNAVTTGERLNKTLICFQGSLIRVTLGNLKDVMSQ
jgi:hypothetical protein